MPEWPIWIGGLLLFIFILSATIAIHEAGHMVAAKKLGLQVPQYSIGFGPSIWSRKGKSTEYHIRAIPLGGFVLIEDATQPEKSYERGALSLVKPWKRQIVFVAGPAVNIVLGIVLLMVGLMGFPYQAGTNVVDRLQTCDLGWCAAEGVGMLPGDTIISIDGSPIANLEDITTAKAGKESIAVIIDRAGEELEFVVPLGTERSVMGVFMATGEAWRTIPQAWSFVTFTIEKNIESLIHLPEKVVPVAQSIVTGERPDDAPGSIVSVGKNYGDMAIAEHEFWYEKIYMYVIYTALLNIAIGAINLLPFFLPLDGGRMFIAFMDSCRMAWAKMRKRAYEPVGKSTYFALASVTSIFVFGFMAMVILSDFSLIFHGNL